MFSDSAWGSWQPMGTQGTGPGTDADREPEDLLHEYATRLNHVIARAKTTQLDAALQQLEAAPKPGHDELAVAMLLSRKRRELLEQFNVLRQEIAYVPGVSLDDWLRFFFTAADISGAAAVLVTWQEAPPGWGPSVEIELREGAAFRRHVAEGGIPLGQLRALSYVAPDGRAMGALEVENDCLTLSAPPFLFEQAKRELDTATQQAPLSAQISYDRTRDVQEGMVLNVRLAIKNLSRDVIVLEAIQSSHRYDKGERFARASLGQLAYEEGLDCFTYRTSGGAVTPLPFHSAVLRPGGERVLELSLKFLEGGDDWRQFRLSYRRFTPEDFARVAYVPVPGPVTQFPPDVIYARLAEVPDQAQADLATVILHPDSGHPLHEARWVYPFHVGKRAFSQAQALRRFGTGGEAVHFSRWQQAWVLRTPEGCALVTPSRVTPYPRVQAEGFMLIDEVDQKVPVRFDERLVATFKSLPLGITEWESHPLGLAASLPKLRLTAFFHEIERLGCTLTVGRTRLDRPCLMVQAPA